MKKKIFSLLGILILSLNTVFCNAVEISYVSLDFQNGEFYIDDEESLQDTQESFNEEENILENDEEILVTNSSSNFQESSLEATENNYEDKKVSRINLLNSEENIFENLSIPENLNYTTVDITDVFTGNIVSHDCNLYLVSNFDETEHWNECSVCGKIVNKEIHTYVDNGWTGGSASNCNENNIHLFTCNCGMSYSNTEGKKEHIFTNSINEYQYFYAIFCKNCDKYNDDLCHYCIKDDGSKISCDNPGTCSLCGHTYVTKHMGGSYNDEGMYNILGNVYCDNCNKFLGIVNSIEVNHISDGKYTFKTNININGNYSSLKYALYNPMDSVTNLSISNNGLTRTATITYKTHVEYDAYLDLAYSYVQNGESCKIDVYGYVTPEPTPPIITNISTHSSDNWSTDTTVNITGTENYCNSVSLTLKDTEGNIYLENIKTPVTNNTWNYEIKPSLESSENTEFILQVSDAIGNTKEQNFYISKVDAIPPKAINSSLLNTYWSKTKDYVFISSDYGIGNVSNSAINTDNYELATENENIFYKGYTFTGDVYGETFVPVYMKDGLNNQNVEFVSVSNLDNTPPTIEDIEYNKTLHNTEITISANDINEKLNATGSGVTGYAISKENEIPDTFQESNTFNLTETGTYYIFITDLVGNVSSKEIYIPIQYKVTINPDEGTWKGDSNPKEYITDEPINLYPEPEKEGYIFKEWSIEGNGEITEDGELIVNGDVTVTPIWEANKYEVTFIDYDVTHNRIMNTTTRELDFNSEINGTYIGDDKTDNAYYPQYRLVSDTSITVSTNPETNVIYRYFEFCYTEKESHINFNDNDNQDGLRPETYKLQLILENGELIDEVILPTTEPDYTFTNLPKYDEQGKEYQYKIIPIISDRYDVLPNPEDENTPEITYSSPNCSINIPKTTTLDGKDGYLTYTIQFDTNLFYKDKIIIIPDTCVTLTDGIKNMSATITQDKTEFTKDDELKITGQIQTTRKHFAGVWTGTFNFNIKYEVKN